jgi:hypothetical protein
VIPGTEENSPFIYAQYMPLVEKEVRVGPVPDSSLWNAPQIDLREAIQNAKEAIKRQSLVSTWVKLETGCFDGHVYRADSRKLRRSRMFRGKWRVTTKGVRYHKNAIVMWICWKFYRLAWEQKDEFIPCPECGKPTDRFRTVSCKVEGGQQTEAPSPWIMLPQKEKK